MSLKYLYAIIVLSTCITAPLFAEENLDTKKTIKILLQEIKKVPASEKRVKMNALKILLRTMNQKTRNEVMRNLQKSFAKHRPQQRKTSQGNTIRKHNNQNRPTHRMKPMRQGQRGGHR
ncbi:MAG: hypothetical protein L3J43_03190 [Sulfurovum sp.]|nr:hypothetical protein [Sulfurovum sp.]